MSKLHCRALIVASVVVGAAMVQAGMNEMGGMSGSSPSGSGSPDATMQQQLTELRAKVAQLEAALAQGHKAHGSAGAMPGMTGGATGMGGMGMGMMKDKDEMGGMMGGMGMMKDMPMMKGMGMMNMMGRQKMGMMGDMPGMNMPSALPGFPGASHLYHVGASDFFLDHGDHIQLTAAQQTALNRLKEKTLLDQSTVERKVAEAEQQLWELTASDQPDAKKIEVKIREIEKTRADARMAFIRAVGEAAQVLTDEQRNALLGVTSADAGAQHKH